LTGAPLRPTGPFIYASFSSSGYTMFTMLVNASVIAFRRLILNLSPAPGRLLSKPLKAG